MKAVGDGEEAVADAEVEISQEGAAEARLGAPGPRTRQDGCPPSTPRELRDYAMVAMLIGYGLRRAELLALRLDSIQQREDHRVIAGLVGSLVGSPAGFRGRCLRESTEAIGSSGTSGWYDPEITTSGFHTDGRRSLACSGTSAMTMSPFIQTISGCMSEAFAFPDEQFDGQPRTLRRLVVRGIGLRPRGTLTARKRR